MEKYPNTHELLTGLLSAERPEINPPPLSRLERARKIVAQRQTPSPQREDIISLLAAFLNLRIRLYHAVIVSIAIAALIVYFSGSNKSVREEAQGAHYNSNIAAVNNSTVLSSIKTFVLNK